MWQNTCRIFHNVCIFFGILYYLVGVHTMVSHNAICWNVASSLENEWPCMKIVSMYQKLVSLTPICDPYFGNLLISFTGCYDGWQTLNETRSKPGGDKLNYSLRNGSKTGHNKTKTWFLVFDKPPNHQPQIWSNASVLPVNVKHVDAW